MKKILLMTAALALLASAAFAQGIDLSAVACPGNAGVTSDAGVIDCAGGGALVLLGVFQPAEAISDLGALDGAFRLQANGDLSTAAGFWNSDTGDLGCNPLGLGSSFARPTSGCTGYTNTFTSGSASLYQGSRRGPKLIQLGGTCARPSPLVVAANQKMFGVQIIFDLSTSAEAGGSACQGCTLPVAITWNSGTPQSIAGTPTTALIGPAVFGQTTTANDGANPIYNLIPGTPTKKHTWGQLKSLYR